MKDDAPLIGTIAKACGVSVDTVRHYERKGVIPPAVRDESGYRRYPAGTGDRVRIVRRALEIGFSLDELARIFRERKAGHPPCRNVKDLAARKLMELDARIASLLALRAALAETVGAWESQLENTGEGQMALLLDSLIS
ncbi:MAG: MerR family DNA-binding transcriptional regulator [Acidobacteriota bacterium]